MKRINLIFNILSLVMLFVFCTMIVGCGKKEEDKKEYTIKYYLNQEDIYLTEKVKEGEVAVKPENPNLEGMEFVSWMTEEELINEYDFSTVVTENLNLYAKFEDDSVSFKVTLKDGEEIVKEITVKKNNAVGDLSQYAPIKEGYTFAGWLNNDVLVDSTFIPTGDIILAAKWEYIFTEEFIDLEFYIDGVYYKGMSFMPGDVVTQLSMYKAEKYGYKFIGWFIGDVMLYDGYMPLKSDKVVAKFEPLGTIYVVTIDGVEREFLEGDVYTLPNKNQKGKTLIGYADENKVVFDGDIVVNSNLVFTSVWKENGTEGNNYVLKLEGKDSITILYGDLVVLPALYKYGYEFIGWSDGEHIYNKGFGMVVVNNLSLTPTYKKYEFGDEYSNVAYTICNLDEYFESLQLPLKTNIELPLYDEFTKASIKWTSSDSSVLTSDGKINRIFHKDRNIEVVMKATVTYNDFVEEKDYVFTVKQSYKSLTDGIAGGYLYPADGLSDLGLETLDIIYGAFLHFDNKGNITDGATYSSNMKTLLPRAHEKGVRVVVSIGAQGTNTIQYIKTISESPALIERFAENLLQYVIDQKFDGIDMDWETPGSSHALNYTKLMKVIYEKFKAYDSELLVTSAIGAGPWQYKYYDLKNSAKYHDYINMMSYDMQSSGYSTFQNALYTSSKNYLLHNDCSIDATVRLYNSVGIKNEQIIIGIPFYGRTFNGSTGAGTAATASGAVTQSAIDQYIRENGSSIVHWDDECKVPYIYIPEKKIFITYDNPQSIAEKMKYVGQKGLAGIMYWQNSQDYNSLLMTAISQNYQYLK